MRLFIAFPLDQTVKKELAQIVNDLMVKGGPVKWVEPQNLHLTVRFLGEVADTKLSSVTQVLDMVAPRHEPISAVFHELGGFPNIHRPRVIWMGTQGPTERMSAIAGDVENQMVKLGFAPEPKGFKPHLTLGRVKEGQRIGTLLDHLRTFSFDVVPFHVDRITLYRSTLTPKGPIYEVLHEARLQP